MRTISLFSTFLLLLTLTSCSFKQKERISYQYYDKGVIKSMSHIKGDSTKDGVQINFYKSGMIKDIRHFTNNKENGQRIAFLDKSGKVDYTCNIKNNRIQGVGYDFYKSGYLYLIVNKKDGIMDGRVTQFYDSCDLLYSITHWIVNGKFAYRMEFDRNGDPKYFSSPNGKAEGRTH